MSTLYPTTREFLGSNDPAIEREFLSRVFLPNGTFKTTYEHRLDDLNTVAFPFIPRRAKILDVAVASGITTAEWCKSLNASGISFSMTATDACIFANLVTFWWLPGVEVLADDNGNILHIDFWNTGCPPQEGQPVFHPFAVAKRVIKSACRLCWNMNDRILRKQRISLLSRSLPEDVEIRQDDLLADNPAEFICAFDVIRAANILTPAHFHECRILAMVATLKGRLREGGLLIVCRTDISNKNNGTIFRLNQSTFEVVARIGSGSEIEHLVRRG